MPATHTPSVTTLNAIRAKSPCHGGWTKLLAHLGKIKADDEPLALLTILDSNGLDDALWVLQYTGCDERLSRHFSAWCAEQVLHIFEADRPGDMRPREAIAVAQDDSATPEQRDAAGTAARAAARDAARAAAWDAAGAAAWAAAGTAAWDAAGAAAGTAARAAARDAAGTAAWDAAGAAAGTAARAAARDAARAAAWDAAGGAAWAAAWAAAGDAQERQLRKMLAKATAQ